MEKKESSDRASTIGGVTIEAHNEPPNESDHAGKEDQGSTTEDSSGPNLTPTKSEDEWEYITGVKLYLVIGMVTLACFIMLLDTSIVATVSQST